LSIEELELREDLTYTERSIKILETTERESLVGKSSECAKCSGAITPKMKLHGNLRKNSKSDYPNLFSNIS
jgi:hypothetical protein